MDHVTIDVRERDEFDAEHVEHSINLPLSEFARVAPGVLRQLEGKSVVIMCRSGNRANLALQQIQSLGRFNLPDIKVYSGGLLEWKRQGLPTSCLKKGHIPIMRQVQLIAGGVGFIGRCLVIFCEPPVYRSEWCGRRGSFFCRGFRNMHDGQCLSLHALE